MLHEQHADHAMNRGNGFPLLYYYFGSALQKTLVIAHEHL